MVFALLWFREFIKSMAQAGKTVLLSSHILSEIEVITDDVVIINRGEILIKGIVTNIEIRRNNE